MRLTTLQFMLGGIAHQPTGIAHFVHHRITGVDTRRAADALHLQAVADVDAGWAHLHAHMAIDAVTQPCLFWLNPAFTRPTAFATRHIIGDGEGVFIEHHALEPRIRAHVHAHGFAQPPGIDVRGAGEKQHPEQTDASHLQGQQLGCQGPDRGKVADKSQRRHDTDGHP